MSGAIDFAPQVTLASAATMNIGAAAANSIVVTGTTAITSLGTAAAGVSRSVRFAAALTLTHNAKSLILPGAANITTAAGDVAVFESLGGGNWICTAYLTANGKPLAGVTFSSARTNTTSGTVVDFAVPSWAKRITVLLNGVSTNGASNLQVRLGTSGGVQATGYSGGMSLGNNAIVTANMSTGFDVSVMAATSVIQAQVVLTAMPGNTWMMSGIAQHSNTTTYSFSSGAVTLSGAITTVRITTAAGNTFDAGAVSIVWE